MFQLLTKFGFKYDPHDPIESLTKFPTILLFNFLVESIENLVTNVQKLNQNLLKLYTTFWWHNFLLFV